MLRITALRCCTVLLFSAVALFSDLNLTGNVTGKLGPGIYTASDIVTIPDGKTLTILPGTTIKFHNYSAISIEGELICRGTPEQPIVFTSWRDDLKGEAAEPFDWNGIKITPMAQGIILENTIMKFSTFGLNVESERTPVQIRRVTFRNNGYANISRSGKIIIAADGMPINYFWPESASPEFLSGNPDEPQRKKQNPSNYGNDSGNPTWKTPVRIGCSIIAVGGGVAWILGNSDFNKQNDLYSTATNTTLVNRYKERRAGAAAIRTSGIIAAILGASGFTLTFLF